MMMINNLQRWLTSSTLTRTLEICCLIVLILSTLLLIFINLKRSSTNIQLKQMHDILVLEGEKYRVATELSHDIIFEYQLDKDEMFYTEKYKELLGGNCYVPNYTSTCIIRQERIHPDDWGIYLEFCQELREGKENIEVVLRLKNRIGEYIWCQILGKTILDEKKKPLRIIGKIVNIDIQKKRLEALEFKATRDPLTEVYNKEVTLKKIDKFIKGSKCNNHAFMLIDLDDFKKVNDNYGHLVGDKILIHVISRIKEKFTEGEVIGRVGGDEFVVFAGNLGSRDEVYDKANLLRASMETVYTDNDNKIEISGSVGVAIYPDDGSSYEQLMEKADQALYQAKEQGKNNYIVYTTLSEVLL